MQIENKIYEEERALYHLQRATVKNCIFAGAADGESALKECRHIAVTGCRFALRYPLWHARDFLVENSKMEETARAPLWYCREGKIADTEILSVKCLRECEDITLEKCKILSPEFGWRCRKLKSKDCRIESEYFLFESRDIGIHSLDLHGKYSFQYTKEIEIEASVLDTKDAFWHSKNVTVRNSTVKGEYLGWYSEGLTLENCRIIGTQPLCYCKKLKLINCTMEQTDLAFEYSEVEAEINGEILSVKNPRSGFITADRIGEIITENSLVKSDCKITQRKI